MLGYCLRLYLDLRQVLMSAFKWERLIVIHLIVSHVIVTLMYVIVSNLIVYQIVLLRLDVISF